LHDTVTKFKKYQKIYSVQKLYGWYMNPAQCVSDFEFDFDFDEARWLILSPFWQLLNQALFLEAAGEVV